MKNKWIILFSGAVLSLWISVGLSHNYEKNLKGFSIVNENNCEVSYEVEIEDDKYIGSDLLFDYEAPFRFKMYNIPIELIQLVGNEEFEKYLNSYNENIVGMNYVATSVEEMACVYSFIKWFDIPKETVKNELKNIMNMDIVPEEYKLTEYDIDFIYSSSVEEINQYYASDYSIVVGGYIYTPKWIISHSKEEILATGINSDMILDKVEYYETLPLPKKVREDFKCKLSDLCGKDNIKAFVSDGEGDFLDFSKVYNDYPFMAFEDVTIDALGKEYTALEVSALSFDECKQYGISKEDIQSMLDMLINYSTCMEYKQLEDLLGNY